MTIYSSQYFYVQLLESNEVMFKYVYYTFTSFII